MRGRKRLPGRRGWRGIFACAIALACGAPEPSPEVRAAAAPEPPCRSLAWDGASHARSVVLVVSDTTRRDRVGIYGGPARTPVFDAFASENLFFSDASTEAPWTKPAVASLFTGLRPARHGVLDHPLDHRDPSRRLTVLESDVLAERFVTLAEVMQQAGYRTAAFVANPWLGPRFGFGQGFDHYDDSFAADDAPGHVVSEAARAWLARQPGDEPFFLYVHYMDAHSPYGRLTPEALARRADEIEADTRPVDDIVSRLIRGLARYEDGSRALGPRERPTLAHLELLYDLGVESFDRAFAELLRTLASRPDWPRTALVVTADHGEALVSRGWVGHGFGLFDDETAVPLAARLPGVGGSNPVGCAVGLVDLLPTLCVYLGLECPVEPGDGTSFLAPDGDDLGRSPRYLVTEGVKNKPSHRALRSRGYKLLYEPEGRRVPDGNGSPWSLYAPGEDPGETHNLLDPERRSAESEWAFERLSAALAALDARATPSRAPRAPLDDATRERLEDLGYLE